MIGAIIRLLRPAHWLKNIIVFLPLFFSGGLLADGALARAAVAFIAFSCAASGVYVLNDLMDIESDRKHPTKCKRPLASGQIPFRGGIAICVALCIVSCALSFSCGGPPALGLAALYIAMNVGYSLGLKKVPLLDVVILASGYVLRMLFGAVAAQVTVSGWLYLTVIAGSFFLGLGKRRGEIDEVGTELRSVLAGYTRDFLDKNMYVCLTLAVAFYSLWARDVTLRLWTVPLVLVILMRYSLDIERGSDGDPMGVIVADRVLIALVIAYVVLITVLVYLPGVLS